MDEIEPLPPDLRERVVERVRSGEFASTSEVIRAGLSALDREDAVSDDRLRRKVEAALADPRPSISAEEVFGELRAHHAAVKARMRGA